MIQFAIDRARDGGVGRIAVNVHHLADEMETGLQGLDFGQAKLHLSDERGMLLGSAGGLRHAMELLGPGPYLVGNADTMSAFDVSSLVETHRKAKKDLGSQVTLSLLPIPEGMGPYRVIEWEDASGKVTSIGAPSKKGWFYAGWAVIERDFLLRFPKGKPADLLTEGFLPAVKEGILCGHAAEGAWFDIGSPELWAETHFQILALAEAGTLPSLWKTRIEEVSLRLQKGVYIRRGTGASMVPSEKLLSPLYLDAEIAPDQAGPRAVLYGLSTVPSIVSNVIAYGGVSQKLR